MCSNTQYLDILWHAEWRHFIQRRLSWFLSVSFKKGCVTARPALLSPHTQEQACFCGPDELRVCFRPILAVAFEVSLWSPQSHQCCQLEQGFQDALLIAPRERQEWIEKKKRKKMVLHATCMHLNSLQPRELPVEDLVFQSIYTFLQLSF